MWSSQQERQKAADFSTAFYDIWWGYQDLNLGPLHLELGEIMGYLADRLSWYA